MPIPADLTSLTYADLHALRAHDASEQRLLAIEHGRRIDEAARADAERNEDGGLIYDPARGPRYDLVAMAPGIPLPSEGTYQHDPDDAVSRRLSGRAAAS